jgi:predicted AAA+ superfamily ATPase
LVGRRTQRVPPLQVLTASNPWWVNPRWAETDPQLRAVASAPFSWRPSLLDDIAPPNLYTLRGPRRVGKSTVVKQTIERLLGSGVDPRRVCFFSADALSGFDALINVFKAVRDIFPDVGEAPRYFFVDEATAIPEWQRALKWLRDNTGVAEECVVATGSSAKDIAGGVTHLAGRRGPAVGLDRLLLPMSFPEFVRCTAVPVPASPRLAFDQFYTPEGRAACQQALLYAAPLIDAYERYLDVGGFPQAVAGFRRTGSVPTSFVRDLWDVVRADLHALGVSRPEEGLGLLAGIVQRLTGTVTLRGLADELGISHPTAGAWLEALANAYMVLFLFQESGGVPVLRAQRKVYPIDPVVAALPSLLATRAPSPELSHLSEAVLAAALFRATEGHGVDRFACPSRLFFYRSDHHGEVDFVVLPGPLTAEAKYIDAAARGEARSMLAKFGAGLLLTRSAIDLDPELTIVPAGVFAWLLEQGDGAALKPGE